MHPAPCFPFFFVLPILSGLRIATLFHVARACCVSCKVSGTVFSSSTHDLFCALESYVWEPRGVHGWSTQRFLEEVARQIECQLKSARELRTCVHQLAREAAQFLDTVCRMAQAWSRTLSSLRALSSLPYPPRCPLCNSCASPLCSRLLFIFRGVFWISFIFFTSVQCECGITHCAGADDQITPSAAKRRD